MIPRRHLYRRKFPNLVSYHKFPWAVVCAHSEQLHNCVAEHYEQLLRLACRIPVPYLVVDAHIELPTEKWLSLLPGMHYILPQIDLPAPLPEDTLDPQLADSPIEWGPLGWNGRSVPLGRFADAYGSLHAHIGHISSLHLFTSPDLRLHCNAVTVSSLHLRSEAKSSLGALDGRPFTLFHFFRPNRAPSEIVKPFSKYYIHHPDLSSVFEAAESTKSPVLHPNKRGDEKRAASMPFTPPTTYMLGIAAREAIIPGDCFGHRYIPWGMQL